MIAHATARRDFAPNAPRERGWWSSLRETLFHQHDHDTVVERAIACVNGERYRVTIRRCRCGDEAQRVERTQVSLHGPRPKGGSYVQRA